MIYRDLETMLKSAYRLAKHIEENNVHDSEVWDAVFVIRDYLRKEMAAIDAASEAQIALELYEDNKDKDSIDEIPF